MKNPLKLGRARLVALAIAVAAAGVFASVGMAGYGAKLVGFSHAKPTANQYPKKVTLCHHTHSAKNPTVTITVSVNALPAHLRHGDTVGPCTDQPAAAAPTQGKAHKAKHAKKPKHAKLKATKANKGKLKAQAAKLRKAGKVHKASANTSHAKARGKSQSRPEKSRIAPTKPTSTGTGHGKALGKSKPHGSSNGTAKGHSTEHGHAGGNGQGGGNGHDQAGTSGNPGHGNGKRK